MELVFKERVLIVRYAYRPEYEHRHFLTTVAVYDGDELMTHEYVSDVDWDRELTDSLYLVPVAALEEVVKEVWGKGSEVLEVKIGVPYESRALK